MIQTTEKNCKYAFGWDSAMSAIAPKAQLASNLLYWGPFYQKAVKEALDGTWKSDREVLGYKDSIVSPFKGPVVDNEGKERLAADAMPDQPWLDKVDFLVKGVEGKVPSGK